MVIVDTNIILRYLLNDDEKLNKKAREIIDNNDILIPNEVIIEACYVLKKLYKVEKEIIYTLVIELMAQNNIYFVDRALIYETFKVYSKTNIDLVDCILYAYGKIEGQEVKTFDKKLENLIKKLG
ncbi:MAG: PIN domain-containing protein [Clostridia bacterium]|nr:PIN domain-containing protein [Clostridia bacterium]